jgi:hypothetical protein
MRTPEIALSRFVGEPKWAMAKGRRGMRIGYFARDPESLVVRNAIL